MEEHYKKETAMKVVSENENVSERERGGNVESIAHVCGNILGGISNPLWLKTGVYSALCFLPLPPAPPPPPSSMAHSRSLIPHEVSRADLFC